MSRHVLIASLFTLFAFSTSSYADDAADRQKAIETAQAFAISRIPSLPQGSVLKIRQVDLDPYGYAHVRLDHTYNSVPVFESEAVVHVNLATGRQTGVTDGLKKFAPVSIVPAVAAQKAREQASAHFKQTAPLGGRDDLMILIDDKAMPYLSWRIHSEGADGRGPVDTIAFVNAQRGGVLRAWDNLHTASATGTGKGFFNGIVTLTTDSASTSYTLRDPSRGNQYTCDMGNKTARCTSMTDADNVWGTELLSDRQTVAVDAQYGTSVTWDYYKTIHGRNGIAGNGVGAYNRVHYSNRYNNAFWSDSCFCMTYGDGDGTTFNPFDSLDVAGHEMTHGVTSRTSNLTYSGESGGLNEASSDIFGTMVEFYAASTKDPGDYLIGEMLYKSSGRSLRNMQQPSSDGSSADCWYSSLGSLNVHYSSGVANHFFYILAEGAANTNICSSASRVASGGKDSSITGIGKNKAAAIWYLALTKYMISSTNYAGARTATLSAATEIYGSTSTEYTAVAKAWDAVFVK